MKKLGKVKVGSAVALGLTLLPLLVFAAVGQIPGAIITEPSQITTIITKVMQWIAGIIMTMAIIMLLYSAVLYLTAGAAPSQLERAKNTLIFAIIGIVVAILAFSVQPFLESFLSGRI